MLQGHGTSMDVEAIPEADTSLEWCARSWDPCPQSTPQVGESGLMQTMPSQAAHPVPSPPAVTTLACGRCRIAPDQDSCHLQLPKSNQGQMQLGPASALSFSIALSLNLCMKSLMHCYSSPATEGLQELGNGSIPKDTAGRGAQEDLGSSSSPPLNSGECLKPFGPGPSSKAAGGSTLCSDYKTVS